MTDAHGRLITYLRISLTKECNFRCLYCMPRVPFGVGPEEDLLSFEELFFFVKIAIDEGVKKIRLTGGEPLARPGVAGFVRMIRSYAPGIELALSTNGYFLKDQAAALAEAGLDRINISLDTLRPGRAKFLAQREVLDAVLAGLEEARKYEFKIKLNTVALRGINEDELPQLLAFAGGRGLEIRFIEFMENTHAYGALRGLRREEILKILGQKYELSPREKSPSSPASLYSARPRGVAATWPFGIIDPHSEDFCKSCNRLRLSASGQLIPCLYFDEGRNLAQALRGRDLVAAGEILRSVLANKPEKNRWAARELSSRGFYQTGG